jgi:chemotaxis protein methyltransferase CheR
MRQLHCESLDAYVERLQGSPELWRETERLLSVSISRFFRDRGLWEVLERQVLPEMANRHPTGIKAWSAGCASGEEVYTLQILWHELRRSRQQAPVMQLWATDINPQVLTRAWAGIYPASSLKEVPARFLEKYFIPLGKERAFAISDRLRQAILWRRHDLAADNPPCSGFHLVLLRNNLLTYYDPTRQISALRKVVTSLAREGLLIIGARESLPCAVSELENSPWHESIFEKIAPDEL